MTHNKTENQKYFSSCIRLGSSCLLLWVLLIILMPTLLFSQQIFYKCQGDTLTVGNDTFTEEGVFSTVFTDDNGNDSLVLVQVINYPYYELKLLQELCHGDSFQGSPYYNDTTLVREFSSQYGCDSIVSIFIDIQEVNIEALEGESHLCDGEFAILRAGSYQNYLWNTGETTREIRVEDAGEYCVLVTNSYGCIDSISKLITKSEMQVEMTFTDVACRGQKTGSISLSSLQFNYSLSDMLFNNIQSPISTLDFEELIAGAYSLRFIDDRSCTLDTIVNIYEPDQSLELGIHYDYNILYAGDYVSPEFSSNIDVNEVSWSLNQNAYDALGIDSMAINYSDSLRLTATDINGCTLSDAIWIEVTAPNGLYVPNAFSPNNQDDVNDFLIMGSDLYLNSIEKVNIWDRWGNLIFTQNSINDINEFRWDGSFNGQKLNPGIYSIQVQYIYMEETNTYTNSLIIF